MTADIFTQNTSIEQQLSIKAWLAQSIVSTSCFRPLQNAQRPHLSRWHRATMHQSGILHAISNSTRRTAFIDSRSTLVETNFLAGTLYSNSRSISPKDRSFVCRTDQQPCEYAINEIMLLTSGRRNQHQILHNRFVPA